MSAPSGSPGPLRELTYRLLLCLHPPRVRERHLADVMETFRDAWAAEVHGRGWRAELAFWGRMVAGTVRWRRGGAPRLAAGHAAEHQGRWTMKTKTTKALSGMESFSWLDVKLGLRMLRKHPALALVSVIGMSVAIAIAGGYYGAIGAMMDPSLPLDDGDRIVSVRYVDLTDPGDAMLQSAHDFVAWRDE